MCICIYLFYIYTIYHVHNTIFECSCWSLLLLNISTLTRKYNGTYTYMFSSIPTCTPCTYPRMLTHTRKHAYTRMYARKHTCCRLPSEVLMSPSLCFALPELLVLKDTPCTHSCKHTHTHIQHTTQTQA